MTSLDLNAFNAVKLSADLTLFHATLTEMSALLSKASPELVHCLVNHIEHFSDLFVFDTELSPTAGAGEQCVTARPSERLTILMAAMRAGNLDLAVIEQAFGHGPSSAEGADHSAKSGQGGVRS